MRKFLAMLLTAIMMMSLVGCGSEDTASKMEKLVEEAEAELEGTEIPGIEIDLDSDGGTLIYCYTLTDIDSSFDLDMIKDALVAQEAAVDEQMEIALEAVQDEIGDECSVLLQYMTSDGELILDKEYK